MVSGEREGGAARALAVGLGDMAVLSNRTGTLIVVGLKTLFQAFGELKPILNVMRDQGRFGNHGDEDDSEPFVVQQCHDHEDEGDSTHHTQH